MIRAGVAGLGAMGQHHARLYSQLDCTLAGVADVDPDRAREIGEKYGVPYYCDYRQLLDKVDVVSIAVPTVNHHPIAMDFLGHGVHCLVEKPITFDMYEAEEMVNIADRNRVNLAVGHIERFNPAVVKLKQIIDAGVLGRLLLISTRRMSPFVPRIKDVGVVMDLATHDIGVSMYLVGKEPVNVFSRVGSQRHVKEDHAVIVLGFSDTTACIEVNWFTPQKVRTLLATGSERTAFLDYAEQTLRVQDSNGGEAVEVQKQEPLRLELEDFLGSVRNNRKPSVDGVEGTAILKICLESSRDNYCPSFAMAR